NLGFNQDIGVFVSVNGAADQLVGWKESAGFAGTLSPNAAFLEATWPVSSGSSYAFKLKWKANKNAAGATIYAGAGPISGQYSPNAAYAETVVSLQASTTYTIWIAWKANMADGGSIYAGAGPLPGTSQFSPTRLTVIPT